MLTATDERSRAQDGFTLIELLMSISIMGIVVGGMTAAMLIAISSNKSTDVSLSESRDLQGAASYFADDVAGAANKDLNGSAQQGIVVGGTARCGTDPALIELRGTSFDSTLAAVTTVTTYALRTESVDGGPSRVLHRLVCSSSAASPAYPLSPSGDTTVARLLSTTVDPVITCTTSINGTASTTSTVACSDATAATVRMRLTSRSGDITPTVIGNRRTT